MITTLTNSSSRSYWSRKDSQEDVIVGAMLGAEEYGFGTITKISEGCVMERFSRSHQPETEVVKGMSWYPRASC